MSETRAGKNAVGRNEDEMELKGDPEDLKNVLDEEYFVRYEAYNRLLRANGIPLEIPDLRRVFAGMMNVSGPLNEKKRGKLQEAFDRFARFVQEYGRPFDFPAMTPEEITERFLDACSRTSTPPDLRELRELCAHGADVHAHDALGFSALKLATRVYNREVTAFLLGRGVDINEPIRYKDGNVSTVWIEKAGYAEVEDLRLMLDAGARPNDRDSAGNTALMTYCAGNPVPEGVALLISRGADPTLMNNEKYTSLHFLARANVDGAAVSLLMEHGAPVDARNDLGETALHVNAKFTLAGDERGTRALLAGGANPDVRTPEGETPLLMAVRCEKERVVRVLIETGANKAIKGPDGKKPFAVAMEKRFHAIARIIDPAAYAEYEQRGDRSGTRIIRNDIIDALRAGKKQYRSDKEGYSWFSRRGDVYLFERFENGASPPIVTTIEGDDDALRYLYDSNRTGAAAETELSVYRSILQSLVG
ncbi:MAG TPA: ankyrin repeat domain-containing protein [Candidatus Ozemobacteraceae bacterium]|nr:ankyrin repeat domain-containing protein [Candidatus Ozemobacteraceae bacterium]